ncbi:hypothetical protein ACIQWN_06115 [Streptomyces vinaceus]|uniref:hypothetical protein n=1 Tax=Streptomyces vinaceus TaxID=1960 RepID=UPI0038047597
MATDTAVHPAEALETARAEAKRLRAELASHESTLTQALEAKDYRRAEDAQQKANALRPAVLLAEAQVSAFQAASHALQAHRDAESAAARQREAEEHADAQLAQAAAGEREAHNLAEAYLEAAREAIADAAAALRKAFEAERRESECRRSIHEIEVSAGRADRAGFTNFEVNNVQPVVDLSPALTAIQRSGA